MNCIEFPGEHHKTKGRRQALRPRDVHPISVWFLTNEVHPIIRLGKFHRRVCR